MARLETDRGFRATYYFHGPHRGRVFDVRAMTELERMGHEVGYHYETLDRAGGDMGRGVRDVRGRRRQLPGGRDQPADGRLPRQPEGRQDLLSLER
jgi:hypothetical protein